ncbi:hypothetical protein [Pollutibacter soli]|uniref:hypothetical protein n=1 Tax=Pollutibacter soli TaxID=3034157 RepID=UPI0030134F34
MALKKTIATILLSLFAFQLMPVKQVGSVLYANRLLEEIPHSTDAATAKFSDEVKHLECLVHNHQDITPAFVSTHSIHCRNITFVTRSSDDIPTPPPNA